MAQGTPPGADDTRLARQDPRAASPHPFRSLAFRPNGTSTPTSFVAHKYEQEVLMSNQIQDPVTPYDVRWSDIFSDRKFYDTARVECSRRIER